MDFRDFAIALSASSEQRVPMLAGKTVTISPITPFGRGRGIRTPDPLLPKQMRYQTAPCPVPAPRVIPAGPAS